MRTTILASAVLLHAVQTHAEGSKLSNAIAKAEASDNSAIQAAGALADMGIQSGLIPEDAGSSMLKNPQLAATVVGMKDGAAIAYDIDQCYSSIQGQDASISSAYSAIASDLTSSDTIDGVLGMGSALFKAYLGTSDNNNPIYQLFRIYLDQQANAGKVLSSAQTNAYEELTPECNSAFDDVVKAYGHTHETVTSLMAGGNKNVTCTNYQNANTSVDMTLCIWPTSVWANEQAIWANVSATFTNYGASLCDISFYVIGLDRAIYKRPDWLPDLNSVYPNGLPQGQEVAISATVPWNMSIAQNQPIVDILKGWYACPNGRHTPAPTAARTARPPASIITGAQQCFLTPTCQQAVAPFADDACAAYNQLLTSGCSTCSPSVLSTAQKSCLEACSPQQCGTAAATDKSDEGEGSHTSGAQAYRVATLAVLVPAAVLAIVVNLV